MQYSQMILVRQISFRAIDQLNKYKWALEDDSSNSADSYLGNALVYLTALKNFERNCPEARAELFVSQLEDGSISLETITRTLSSSMNTL